MARIDLQFASGTLYVAEYRAASGSVRECTLVYYARLCKTTHLLRHDCEATCGLMWPHVSTYLVQQVSTGLNQSQPFSTLLNQSQPLPRPTGSTGLILADPMGGGW